MPIKSVKVDGLIKNFVPSYDEISEILSRKCGLLMTETFAIKREFQCQGDFEYNKEEFPTYAKIDAYLQHCQKLGLYWLRKYEEASLKKVYS